MEENQVFFIISITFRWKDYIPICFLVMLIPIQLTTHVILFSSRIYFMRMQR